MQLESIYLFKVYTLVTQMRLEKLNLSKVCTSNKRIHFWCTRRRGARRRSVSRMSAPKKRLPKQCTPKEAQCGSRLQQGSNSVFGTRSNHWYPSRLPGSLSSLMALWSLLPNPRTFAFRDLSPWLWPVPFLRAVTTVFNATMKQLRKVGWDWHERHFCQATKPQRSEFHRRTLIKQLLMAFRVYLTKSTQQSAHRSS